MLEVHPPHKPLRGFWDFLIHLLIITVGLFIATQIESCVEWRHHVHLAEKAREELRAEITKNLKDLKDAQPAVKQWRQEVDDDLITLKKIQDNPDDPDAQKAKLAFHASDMTLSNTAWHTAQSTGALTYMPYEEAERYSSIYQSQFDLLALDDKPMEDVGALNGLINKFDLSNHKKITREEASEMAEKLGLMKWHLAIQDGQLKVSIEQAQAFFENRPANDNFTEDLK
jgi:hypothetical protein